MELQGNSSHAGKFKSIEREIKCRSKEVLTILTKTNNHPHPDLIVSFTYVYYVMSVMEVRRVVLLSVILSNLLTLECSVLLNSARTPPVNTQCALLGILKFQDYRILVPRSRLTFHLNTSETTETTGICILHIAGHDPSANYNEVFGVALFPSSVKHQRIVFPVLVNRRAKRCCLYYANASATFRPLIGDILFKLNPGPTTNQAMNNVRSHRSPNVAFCLLNARSLKNKTA